MRGLEAANRSRAVVAETGRRKAQFTVTSEASLPDESRALNGAMARFAGPRPAALRTRFFRCT
jgi:hypothetical protein